YSDGIVAHSSFDRNKFNAFGASALNFNGGISHSSISHNNFYRINLGNEVNYRCISFGANSVHNSIIGNVAQNNPGETTVRGPFMYGGDYSTIIGNNVTGAFSELVANPGTSTIFGGNVFQPLG